MATISKVSMQVPMGASENEKKIEKEGERGAASSWEKSSFTIIESTKNLEKSKVAQSAAAAEAAHVSTSCEKGCGSGYA